MHSEKQDHSNDTKSSVKVKKMKPFKLSQSLSKKPMDQQQVAKENLLFASTYDEGSTMDQEFHNIFGMYNSVELLTIPRQLSMEKRKRASFNSVGLLHVAKQPSIERQKRVPYKKLQKDKTAQPRIIQMKKTDLNQHFYESNSDVIETVYQTGFKRSASHFPMSVRKQIVSENPIPNYFKSSKSSLFKTQNTELFELERKRRIMQNFLYFQSKLPLQIKGENISKSNQNDSKVSSLITLNLNKRKQSDVNLINILLNKKLNTIEAAKYVPFKREQSQDLIHSKQKIRLSRIQLLKRTSHDKKLGKQLVKFTPRKRETKSSLSSESRRQIYQQLQKLT